MLKQNLSSFVQRRNIGIRFAERTRGVYQAMIPDKPSMVWLLNTVEELIRREKLREFYRTLGVGSIVYVVQKCADSHGRFLELSEYCVGEWRSFIIIPEGQEGRGWWGNCVLQMRKVVNYLELCGAIGSRDRKAYVGNHRCRRWWIMDGILD
jgi:hypothetical protein